MKRIFGVLLLMAMLICSGTDFLQDAPTVHLARMMYEVGRNESDETLMMLGSVMMNRMDNEEKPEVMKRWGDILSGVLYDERCLKLAHSLMMGERTLPPDVLEFAATNHPLQREGYTLYVTSGNYAFYEVNEWYEEE